MQSWQWIVSWKQQIISAVDQVEKKSFMWNFTNHRLVSHKHFTIVNRLLRHRNKKKKNQHAHAIGMQRCRKWRNFIFFRTQRVKFIFGENKCRRKFSFLLIFKLLSFYILFWLLTLKVDCQWIKKKLTKHLNFFFLKAYQLHFLKASAMTILLNI